MSKIRVLQIIDSLNIGGAEVLAVNTANLLYRENVDSYLCVTRKEGDLKRNIDFNRVNYFFLERKRTIDFKAILKLKKIIIQNRIDIIHAHSSSYFIATCVKMIYPKVKIYWHDHFGNSEFLNNREKFPLKFCSRFFHSIISVNDDLKIWSQNKLKTKKVYQLNNFAFFKNDLKLTVLKGLNNKRIIHLAGFTEQKDHINLLKAFKIINKIEKEWSLHLVGKNYNDEYSNSVVDFINENNFHEKVFMYDSCIDIKNILNQSTIGVLSSKSEGLPISLLEYGLANLPVLATDVGNCAKVINNKNGIVAPNRSDIFAERLLKIIQNETISENIRIELNKNVVEKFTSEIFLKNLINIYTN